MKQTLNNFKNTTLGNGVTNNKERGLMFSSDSQKNAELNVICYEKIHGIGSYKAHGRENGKYTGFRRGAPLRLLNMFENV